VLVVPDNITLLHLPPYSPQLNPNENIWDEIREKIFKNYALKSIAAVLAKLRAGNPLYRAQSLARSLNHLIPLYRQLTLI
jgi:transposase